MGTIKVKKDGEWVKLPNYGVEEFPDAPSDGKTYGRKNKQWSEIVASNQYLDYDSLFPDMNGTLSDENYQKIVDAWESKIDTIYIDNGFTSMGLTEDESTYTVIVNILSSAETGGVLQIGSEIIKIDKTNKTYTVIASGCLLKTGDLGTKYLSDNGQYLTPPIATPTTAGYMSAEDKNRVDDIVNFGTGSNAVTTLVNIPTNKRLIKATLSSASKLSIKESARALNVGEEIYLNCNPTASFTQPIPTTGSFRSMSGSSITTTSGVPFEMSILKIATKGVMYSITVKEKD